MMNSNFFFPDEQRFSEFQKWKKQRKEAITPKNQDTEPTIKRRTHLPENFAKLIFQYELDAESNEIRLEDVIYLLELYRVGTEYYQEFNDEKYLVFKNKTQQLLLMPHVQQLMENRIKKIPEKSQNQIKQDSEFYIMESQRRIEHQNNMKVLQEISVNTDSLDSFIKLQNDNEGLINNLVQNQIIQQDQAFLERLNRRRKQNT